MFCIHVHVQLLTDVLVFIRCTAMQDYKALQNRYVLRDCEHAQARERIFSPPLAGKIPGR